MKKIFKGVWIVLQILILAYFFSFVIKPLIMFGAAFILGLMNIDFSNNLEFLRNLEAVGNIAPFILAIYIWKKILKNRKAEEI